MSEAQEKSKLTEEEQKTLNQLKLLSEQAKRDIRAQVLMYVQDIEHLPFKDVEALLTRIKSIKDEANIKRYALIVHDKDKKEDSDELVAPHVHVVFEFTKRVVVSSFAKKLDEETERFEIMTKRGTKVERAVENSMAYITHRTKNASDKYQYSFDDVKANFDYKKFMDKTFEHLKPKTIIEQFSKGLLSRQKTEALLYNKDPYNVDRNFKRLDDIENAKGRLEYYNWKEKMKKNNQEKIVLWFCGEAGSGKTSEAKHFLSKRYKEYFVSGGSRDAFEDYNNEHGILLDDVRPGFLSYSDMLKMLDPYEWEPKVSARYHNKRLQGETYIVTCPLDPYDFYRGVRRKEKLGFNDKFDQLNRRITAVVHFDFTSIILERLSIGFDPNTEEIIKQTYTIKRIGNAFSLKHSLKEMHELTDGMVESFIDLPKFKREDLTWKSDFNEERIKVGKTASKDDETQSEKNLDKQSETQLEEAQVGPEVECKEEILCDEAELESLDGKKTTDSEEQSTDDEFEESLKEIREAQEFTSDLDNFF